MKKLVVLAAAALLCSGCATIFTRSSYPLTFTSTPSGADITITNRDGRVIYSGTTPADITLKAAAGYMKREEYTVTVGGNHGLPESTFPILCSLDGWYFGNLLLGGLIGMLIIDPASGAMYRFSDSNYHVDLRSSDSYAGNECELRIIDISEVPEGAKLDRLN